MTPVEAAQVLDLPPRADAEQIRARFLEKRAELEKKIAEALTPGLQERYRQALGAVTEAYETLVLAAEGDALPGAAPASAPPLIPAAVPPATPPTFARRVLWHIRAMLLGGLMAIFGGVCLGAYNLLTEGTGLAVPDATGDGGFTWVVGFLGFVVFPGFLMWRSSLQASAQLPFKTRKALLVVLGSIAIFVVSAAWQSTRAPRPGASVASAPISSSALLSQVSAPASAGPTREPTPDELAAEGHALATGTNGGAANPARAIELYQQAAAKGSALAMTYLAEAYEAGTLVTADPVVAAEWKTKALETNVAQWKAGAAAGDAVAASRLGNAFWEGSGVPEDSAQAVALWEQGADGGVAASMYGLGMAYASGAGVEKDLKLARAWYAKAAALKLEVAEEELAKFDQELAHAAANVAAAEARLAKTGNPGKLVSLAPGFAGWHGRHLQAPKGFEMLEASDVYLGVPWGKRRVGENFVISPGDPHVSIYRMVPAASLKQARLDSESNSYTSLFSFFEETRVVRQKEGYMTRASDLCGGVGLGWVVYVWVNDWGTGAPDSMNIGFGVVAGNASLNEGLAEAFKLAVDGFHKHGGKVMHGFGVKAGVAAKIDYEQLRRDNLKVSDALMPFEFEFVGPGSESEAQEFNLVWRLSEDPQEFVRFVRNFPRGERTSNLRPRFKSWFGYTDFWNMPRRGLGEPVFVEPEVVRPLASAELREWVAAWPVTKLMDGVNPGIVSNNTVYRTGDVVDRVRGITLLDYDPETHVAVFEDSSKAIAGRSL